MIERSCREKKAAFSRRARQRRGGVARTGAPWLKRTPLPIKRPRTIRSTATFRQAGRSLMARRGANAIRKVSSVPQGSMATHVRAMLDFCTGVPTLDYGNNIRQMAKEFGVADALIFRIRAAYIRPLFCRASVHSAGGALRRSEDIYRTDERVKE